MIGWIGETEKFELKIGVFDQNESERNLPGEFALSKIILPLSLYFHIIIYIKIRILSMTFRNMKLTQRYTCSENNNTRPSLPSVLLLDIDEPIFFTPCEIRQRDARIPGYWNFRWLSRSDWRYNHESTVDRDATNRVIRSDPLCPIEPPRRRSLPALHRSCIRALG